MTSLLPFGLNRPSPNRLGNHIDSILDGIENPLWDWGQEFAFPKMEVYDLDDGVTYTFEVPGLTRDNVEVFFDAGYLVIRGKREKSYESKPAYSEISSYGEFERRVNIGIDLDPDQVTAKCSEGILEVHIARDHKVKPQKVQVE